MAWRHRTVAWGREPGRRPGPRRLRRGARLAPALLLAFWLPACASTLPPAAGPAPASGSPPPRPFVTGRDTFAFPNLVRAHSPERSVAFANYCIVMARGASQFFRFARFVPEAPAVSDAEYARLTRQVFDVPAWRDPWPATRRVQIPGYPDLHAFSRAREAAVKAAFDSSVLSMLHWRTWRVALPLLPGHQPRVARELVAELDAGRPAPVMISNFPDPDLLNHAVLVYGYRPSASVVEFLAYDPNDPANPLGLYFDPASRGFWIGALPYSPPGRVRAFRLYASPLL
jgi:hypothetical protein